MGLHRLKIEDALLREKSTRICFVDQTGSPSTQLLVPGVHQGSNKQFPDTVYITMAMKELISVPKSN